MLRHKNRILLTSEERDRLAIVVGEPCNPETVDEYNAWLDHACKMCDASIPDLRILAAILQQMKLPE